MFLKEIETQPAEGMTKIAFRKLREAGEAIPEILHLVRFKRRSTNHLISFTEEVMRGPSPLSPGMRELIGAYFSKRNQCSFCSDAHAATAVQYLEKDLVDEVLSDVETSSLDLAHKELFRYIGKLAENPVRVTSSDIAKLKEVGWSEEAIYDALTVAAVFKFYNTWNNGAGVQNMSSANYVHTGKVLTNMGYCLDFKLSRLVKSTARKLIAMLKSLVLMDRDEGSEHGRTLTQTKSASVSIGLTCPAPSFTAIETSFFKQEGLNISARDE